jgi:LPS sulfotransferase NodH
MSQPTSFFVFTAVRSGSAWLIDTLSSHPAVLAYGELFLAEGRGRPAYGSQDAPYFETFVAGAPPGAHRNGLLAPYLRELYAPRPGIGAIGFKLVYGQAARTPGLLQALAASGACAVHLLRANLLEAAVSFDMAKASGVFHLQRGAKALPAPVHVNARGLHARLEQQEESSRDGRRRLERFGFRAIEVFYEDLVERRAETMACALEFLGVDKSPDLAGRFAKSPGSLAERVENLDEVHEALSGTRFEWMLGSAPRERAVS